MDNQNQRSQQNFDNSYNNSFNEESDLFPLREILKLIPKFSGNSSELRIYINKINELWSYVKDGRDQAKFITVLKNRLSGEAALLLLEEDGLETWNEIKTILQLNFSIDPNHSNNLAMLQTIKQDSKEDVQSFCNRIKEILTKIKSVIPNGATKSFWFEHNERQAIQSLEDGLKDSTLQSRMIAARKPTFLLASQYAIEVDNRLTSKNINFRSELDKTAVKFCSYCKKNNHLIDNCRLLKENTKSKNTDLKQNKPKPTFKDCEFCNKNNHTSDICYKNPNNTKNGSKHNNTVSKNNDVNHISFSNDTEDLEECKQASKDKINLIRKSEFARASSSWSDHDSDSEN